MDSKDFGLLALQLLKSAQVPGDALEQAFAFMKLAEAIAEGRAVIVEKDQNP